MPVIPTMMRAARFDRRGGPEVLSVRTVPVPVPGQGEVLVRVHAAGLNPKDALFRARAPRRRDLGTGFDFAGEVVRCGGAVRDLLPGDRVWGFLDGSVGGTAAEYVTVPRAWLALAPAALDWAELAGLPLVASAALQALRDVAHLRPGERVLVLGAAGGVGSAAIQVARAIGAHVTAGAHGAGIAHVRALGADAVLDDASAPSAPVAATFDVVLDCAGGTSYATYRRLLRRGGRGVTVAPNLPVMILAPLTPLLRRVVGGPRLGFVIVRPRADDLAWLARLSSEGALRLPVSGTWPLEAIVAAHHALGARGVIGKRVLVVSPEATAASAPSPLAGDAVARIEEVAA